MSFEILAAASRITEINSFEYIALDIHISDVVYGFIILGFIYIDSYRAASFDFKLSTIIDLSTRHDAAILLRLLFSTRMSSVMPPMVLATSTDFLMFNPMLSSPRSYEVNVDRY